MQRPSESSTQPEDGVLRTQAGLGDEAGAGKSTILRLLTDWKFAKRAVRHALGLPVPMETEDRRILEQVIFPYFASLPETRSVLFVGCDWYTRHYERSFFRGKDYWTIDALPGTRKFAGKQHVVAPLEKLGEFFPESRFDLILCNGVYGWGLNSREQCEEAFGLCHSRLTDGGYFVLGWDDIPARTPVPLEDIESLRRFKQVPCPPLGGWRYRTDTPYNHTYDFYRK